MNHDKSHFYLWGLNTMMYQANQCTWYHISECSVNPDGLHAPKEAALSCQVALFEAPTMAMLPTAHAACQGPWRRRGAALGSQLSQRSAPSCFGRFSTSGGFYPKVTLVCSSCETKWHPFSTQESCGLRRTRSSRTSGELNSLKIWERHQKHIRNHEFYVLIIGNHDPQKFWVVWLDHTFSMNAGQISKNQRTEDGKFNH